MMIKKQTGATLIYVLLVFLLIMLVGTFAIRQGVFSLKLSTNSQIQALLNQNSNAALFKIQNPAFLSDYLRYVGLLGFIRQPENTDKELVFCFKNSSSNNFDLSDASIIYVPAGTSTITNNLNGTAGYCNPNNISFFTSARKAVLTQVTIKQFLDNKNTSPLTAITVGTDLSNLSVIDNSTAFQVFVVSILPKMSNASESDISACLSMHMSQPPNGVNQNTPTDCLAALNVPYDSQTAVYQYMASF